MQEQQHKEVYQYHLTHEEMHSYFHEASPRYAFILSGIALLIFGIWTATNFGASSFTAVIIILGLGSLIVGCLPLLQSRPPSSDYEKWVTERSKQLYKTAIQRLHVDESQCESIIEVQGGISSLLQLTKKFPEKEIVMKRRSDGTRHYSINVTTYIFLTKDDIAVYSGYINALSQYERFEDADHYYYHDIVGVSTSGPIYSSLDGPSEKERQRQGFLVRMTNGDVVGTDYANSVIIRSGDDRVEVKGVDKVVAQLLYLINEHKVSAIEANQTSKNLI